MFLDLSYPFHALFTLSFVTMDQSTSWSLQGIPKSFWTSSQNWIHRLVTYELPCRSTMCFLLWRWIFLFSFMTICFCCLPWQSVISSSEDSLLLSYVAVSCLTLSSFVFFYRISFVAWVSSVPTMIIFKHCFTWIPLPFKNLLHAIPNLRFRHTIPWI